MRVVVLGANGGCGKELVKQAKARGHDVRAVVRSKDWQPPEGVEVVRGDLTDEAFLTRALEGRDVVLSALGLSLKSLSPFTKPAMPDFLTRAMPALVAAAKANGVKRIVAISAGGVGDSFAKMPAFFKGFIKLTALRFAYAELEVMERVLLGSGLEVLIPRPPGLTDEPATGKAIVVTGFNGRATIPRADVAAWMLDRMDGPLPSERTPMITVTGGIPAA